MEKKFAEVAWTVSDVQGYAALPPRERKLTREEALEFLVGNAKYLRDRLVEVGWEVLGSLLWDWLDEQDALSPCGPIMTHLGWGYWQTGGHCTAWGYNLDDDRYLLLTSVVHDCSAPVNFRGETVCLGLYDCNGDYVEDHEFISVEEFVEAWEGPLPHPGMMTQELFDQIMHEEG